MQWEGEVGDGGVWTSAVGGQWEQHTIVERSVTQSDVHS